MAHRVFFSTSTQSHNAGPRGYIEKKGMEAICSQLRSVFDLDRRFFFVHSSHGLFNVLGPQLKEAQGAEIYIALHSNAVQKGTVAYYFSSSVKGKHLASCLFKHLAPLSPGRDTGGVRAHDSFWEVHMPPMPSVLLELEAHDWLRGVLWLTGKRKTIAKAIYRGVCDYYGLVPKPAIIGTVKPKPKPKPKPPVLDPEPPAIPNVPFPPPVPPREVLVVYLPGLQTSFELTKSDFWVSFLTRMGIRFEVVTK